MPDSTRTVEIVLDVKANKAELAAVSAEMEDLKRTTGNAAISMAELAAAAQKPSASFMALNPGFAALAANSLIAGQTVKGAGEALADTGKKAEAAGINMAAMERNTVLLTAGMTRMIPGTGALGSEINLLGRVAVGTANEIGLLQTVMVGAGIAGALAFTAALAGIITKGIELQKTVQNVKEGVEGTLSTDSSRFGGGKAQQAGTAAVDLLTESAKKAEVPLSELAKGFDTINRAATRANASIKQQVELVTQLTANSGALHITQDKLITDLNALLNGQTRNTNALAQRLGLEKDQVLTARENGTITDLLISKVQEYTAAHQESGDTIERAQQKVQASFENLAASATKDTVQPVTKALQDLAATMNGPDVQAGVAAILAAFNAIIAAAGPVISAMQEVGKAIVAALSAASNFMVQSAQMVSQANETGFAPPPGLSGAEASALSNRLAGQEALQSKAREEAQTTILDEQVVTAKPGLSAPPGGFPKEKGGGKKRPSQDGLDQQKISEIMSEINEKQAAYNAGVERNNVNHKLGLESLDQENAKNYQLATQMIAGIDTSKAKLVDMQIKIKAVGEAQGGLNDKENTQINNLQKAIDKLDLMNAKMQLAQSSNTWMGQFQQGLVKLGDEFTITGTKASQFFGQTMQTGIDGVSQGLTGLIFGAKNWQQAFVSAAESIVQSLIKLMLQQLLASTVLRTANQGDKLPSASAAAAAAAKSAADIPYIGWILAPIAAAAVYAAALAFAQGGIVPGGYSGTDNRVAMVRSGEGVITPEGVAHIGGESSVHAINSLSFVPKYQFGGMVGSSLGSSSSSRASGSGGSGRDVHIHNWTDEATMRSFVLNHPDSDHHIIETVRKNRYSIKV